MGQAQTIHRKGHFEHSLCGKPVPNSETSMDDKLITCPECRKILCQITDSDTKTKLIRKILAEDEDDSLSEQAQT